MRAAIVIALLVAYATCQSVVFSSYSKPAVNKYCRRNVVATNSALTKTINLVSTLGCVSIKDQATAAQGRYGVMGFQMSSLLLPNYAVYGFGINGKGTPGDIQAGAYAFGARFAIDTIVEYNETNGVPGYQPASDKTIAAYTMADLLRISKWSAITDDISTVGTNTTVHKLTTQLKSDALVPFTVSWGAMITTDEVVAGDSTKVVLTPNSLKTVFDLQGFKYASADTKTRIAIGTVLISAGATAKWASTAKSVDGDRPNEVTNNQGVYGIGASASSNTNGYFSYQKFVTSTEGSSTKSVTLTAGQDFVVDNDAKVDKASDEANLSIKRTWFSLSDRVTSFNWDPSLGSQETQENTVPTTNSASRLSVTICAVAFFVTVFLM